MVRERRIGWLVATGLCGLAIGLFLGRWWGTRGMGPLGAGSAELRATWDSGSPEARAFAWKYMAECGFAVGFKAGYIGLGGGYSLSDGKGRVAIVDEGGGELPLEEGAVVSLCGAGSGWSLVPLEVRDDAVALLVRTKAHVFVLYPDSDRCYSHRLHLSR